MYKEKLVFPPEILNYTSFFLLNMDHSFPCRYHIRDLFLHFPNIFKVGSRLHQNNNTNKSVAFFVPPALPFLFGHCG